MKHLYNLALATFLLIATTLGMDYYPLSIGPQEQRNTSLGSQPLANIETYLYLVQDHRSVDGMANGSVKQFKPGGIAKIKDSCNPYALADGLIGQVFSPKLWGH